MLTFNINSIFINILIALYNLIFDIFQSNFDFKWQPLLFIRIYNRKKKEKKKEIIETSHPNFYRQF